MIQSLMQFYTPGIGLVSQIVQDARSGKKINLKLYSRPQIEIIRHATSDYVLHIWTFLGDTRYNRQGYRQAIELLENQLAQYKQENDNAA
jgi:hypothetical protein